MLEKLSGYKTYLGIGAGLGYLIAIQYFGVDSNETVWGLIAAWTGVSIRNAIGK